MWLYPTSIIAVWPLSLDDDVAVGHLAVALVVRAVDEEARRLLEHVRVFHDPDRVASHRVDSEARHSTLDRRPPFRSRAARWPRVEDACSRL